MEYNFREIEQNWQQHWSATGAYKVSNGSSKPKFYVLDMFPYPSGAGLHVGHPLGYIASDIYSRYKRLKGFNVLHPMGYDSFGLPAEQYALDTGQHPAITTEQNIKTFRSQLDRIGFCFDWSREIRTSDPGYYKWTQWLFLKLFNSWYDSNLDKARNIKDLVSAFEAEGSSALTRHSPAEAFTAEDWKAFNEKKKQDILMNYRLAYSAFGEVNWCEALGTVLANDEVINGVSERGGHPVVKKKMRQWYLRITEYAERLLKGLENVEFTESLKEQQRNWIGKSQGAEIRFSLIPTFSPGGEGELKKGAALVPKYKVSNMLQYEHAKRMRKEFTAAENMLWQALRNSQLGVKFRRQHPIEDFIVDFACLQRKLIIEVDGGYHETQEQRELDAVRTSCLEEIGFSVIRFTNEEVLQNTQGVLTAIKKALPPRGEGLGEGALLVYTTRPDTIFGVDFMVLAPEHALVAQIVTEGQRAEIDSYLDYVKSRSERERMAEVKQITGCFTGAYAVNPFDGREIPIWIAEYVLAGYGTGAIMGVPCGDQRDFNFAKHFGIPITNIIGEHFNGEEANATKDAVLENSGFLNGLQMRDAINVVLDELEDMGIGKRKINYRMRDAGFSRQRYWGEPFPIVWKDGVACTLSDNDLPLELPHVDKYGPGPEGEGPLANITEWVDLDAGGRRETSTMPGYAGSSWYFLRYMDPHNDAEFCSREASDYWGQVDLYVGGTEHAVGHLLYSRMWTKVLYDLGLIGHDEPYKKLLNQGMIQGASRFVYRLNFARNFGKVVESLVPKSDIEVRGNPEREEENKYEKFNNSIFVSHRFIANFPTSIKEAFPILKTEYNDFPDYDYLINKEGYAVGFSDIHVDVKYVDGVKLDIDAVRKWRPEYKNAIFILEDGSISSPDRGGQEGAYICGAEVEKMSKSKYNTVNPNELVEKYGADTFRMYEMFLGPVEMSKPWDTKGIEGVHRFLRKLWRLFFDEIKGKVWTEEKATDGELKVLHRTIKKIEDDTEKFSFNTAVSAFMVCVNDLVDLKCHKKEVLAELLILLTPYAPHISEELWKALGNKGSILDAPYPVFKEAYVVESAKEYPVSINGRVRTNISITLDASQEQVESIVLSNETVQKWLAAKPAKKIIFVKGKMINVVV